MDYDYQFFGCEINGEYFNGAKKRIINHASQLKIGYS